MSRLDNYDALEKQLADLQVSKGPSSPGKIKKIPPAVPPKKKAQPQVPHSAVVNTLREPSYSSKISPALNSSPLVYNHGAANNPRAPKDYANYTHLGMTAPSHSFQQALGTPLKSCNATYSNIQSQPIYARKEDSKSPPPIPPPSLHFATTKSFNPNQNSEEYMLPPSPVSSNYSELVRATANINFIQDRPSFPPIYQNEYPDYGTSHVPTYESLYEPINPRPHSNNSITNNNPPQSYRNDTINVSKPVLPKEEEVDALTDLLVQSISDSQDLDVFGICIKCNEKVIGEGSGCTAMGNMYHVKCFCCHRCKVYLQGKPFYAVEGQPYCETDYYETLEKCSVCRNPILDRILRATGKPYHPTCFTCVVCGKSLDGIPFTVDAMNQIHCIEDFHRKFAPRCCVCELPIMPEEGEEETVRVVALDRSFHVRCYRCEDCGLLLSSEAEGRGCYPLDDHILCKNCNGHRIRMITNVMTTDL